MADAPIDQFPAGEHIKSSPCACISPQARTPPARPPSSAAHSSYDVPRTAPDCDWLIAALLPPAGAADDDDDALLDLDFDQIVLEDASPARQRATECELATVPTAVRDLFSVPMRSVQARALGYKGIGSGRDVIIVAATGTGKSMIQYSLAAADAIAALSQGETAPRPLDLVVVPTKAVGDVHERDATDFLERACEGLVPQHWVPRAAFARRRNRAAETAAENQARLCCKKAMPHEQPLKEKTREELGWCVHCYKQRNRSERVMIAACDRLKNSGPSLVSPLTGRSATRTRSATGVDAGGDAGGGKLGAGGRPLRRGGDGGSDSGSGSDDAGEAHVPRTPHDCPLDWIERAVAEDATLLIAVVTASALRKASPRARLLRQALATRGVKRLFIDEAHCAARIAMAAYSKELAEQGESTAQLQARQQQHGHPPLQVVTLSATWPPSCHTELLESNGVSSDAVRVRCSVDRPELRFLRMPCPRGASESFADWCARGLDWLLDHAPVYYTEGRVVVFVTFAADALRCAQLLHRKRFRRPRSAGGKRDRPCFAYVGSGRLTDAKLAAVTAGFQGDPHSVLFATEALTHGATFPGIRLLAHWAVANGPIEFWQRSGRAARQRDEYALVVQAESARLHVQRLSLVDRANPDALVGTRLVERHCRRRCCARRPTLLYLGELAAGRDRCSGCDECDRTSPKSDDGTPHLGGLPWQFDWCEASAAAVHVLASLPTDPVATNLPSCSAFLDTPPCDAVPPFDTPGMHDLLVRALLVEKSILERLEPIPGLACGASAYLYADREALHQYKYENRRLSVLVPDVAEPGDDEGCAVGRTPARSPATPATPDASRLLQIRSMLDQARTLAREAAALLEDKTTRAGFVESASDLHLLAAARGDPYVRPGGAGSGMCTTPPKTKRDLEPGSGSSSDGGASVVGLLRSPNGTVMLTPGGSSARAEVPSAGAIKRRGLLKGLEPAEGLG